MLIQLVSDLHLEHTPYTVDNVSNSDILVLAGDTCAFDQKERVLPFLRDVCGKFKHVLFVTGNHEYYGGSIDEVNSFYENMASKIDNFYFLNNSSIEIGGYLFVGGTLWTDLNKGDPLTQTISTVNLNDYKRIDNFTGATWIRLHNDARNFIEEICFTKPESKIIVITHHIPSMQCVHPKYGKGLLNHSFASDLDEIIRGSNNMYLWLYGHSHSTFNMLIGDCLVANNPKGYYDENKEFHESKTYDLLDIVDNGHYRENYLARTNPQVKKWLKP